MSGQLVFGSDTSPGGFVSTWWWSKDDIRSGADFQAFKRRDYRSANSALRVEWAFWRQTCPKYRFGRHKLMPFKSTAEGIARYVGKYISKYPHALQRAGVFHLLTGWLVMVHQMVAGVPIRFDRFENVAANRFIKQSPPHENQIHQQRTLW